MSGGGIAVCVCVCGVVTFCYFMDVGRARGVCPVYLGSEQKTRKCIKKSICMYRIPNEVPKLRVLAAWCCRKGTVLCWTRVGYVFSNVVDFLCMYRQW